jgi:hypothetical protein
VLNQSEDITTAGEREIMSFEARRSTKGEERNM